MAFSSQPFNRTALAGAALAACTLPFFAGAQTERASDSASTVTITAGPNTGTVVSPGVAGFGDMPLSRSPLQASIISVQQLGDAGIASIGGLTRLDASLGDAYNAEGYWSILSVRGYTLDNRFNYRRDGLPINAETAIALDNKERIELFKGTSGIQAGTSAPGGLVNLVVKRPVGGLRSARVEFKQAGTALAAIDLSERFGDFGVRLNAAAEHLDPPTRNSRGSRSLWALAGDWQISRDSQLQAEIESSHQRQPSTAGFSMLGNSVPAASSINPRINLNDQPWRQPVVMDGKTASLRWTQTLSADWRLTAHAQQQSLKSDDRTAFPYGVYDANYECAQWCDRFAPDGTFTYWEYVSNNERRTSRALQVAVAGRLQTAGVAHHIEAGALKTTYRGRFEDQIFDIAGTGRIDGALIAPPSPGTLDPNTNRDERSQELFLRDAMQIGADWQLWAGLRHTQITRNSERTSPSSDGLRATAYQQSATLPWLALAYALSQHTQLYGSWGQGLESDVAPNRKRYSNAGLALPALKSRQFEIGIKHNTARTEAAFTIFDINRPQAADIGACNSANTCVRRIDGSARHRGLEGQWKQQMGAWQWQASAMWLDAQRQGSVQSAINGQRPVNVPAATLRLGTEFRPEPGPTLPAGLALQANLTAESNRVVLPYDTSVRIPGWTRVDIGARWRHDWAGNALTWRVGIDNLADRRAWKESPYQFGHVYLYPLAPRTARASVQLVY